MKTISASEFRAHCLAVVDEVHSTREPVLITKYGKPVVRLVAAGKPEKFIGRLKGVFKIVGDTESPTWPPEAWGPAPPAVSRDLRRINDAAKRLNSEATDVLNYQATDNRPLKRGRGRPRHTP